MKKCDEVESMIKDYMKKVAGKDVEKGVKIVEDLVLVYKMDEELFKEVAKIVMSKENVEKHFELVIECLMKLPWNYLDRSIVGYGEAHSEKSEFTIRVKYIKYNGNVDDEVKREIIKACDVNNLDSDELKKLEDLHILKEEEEMMELYRKTLKSKEEENKLLKKEIAELKGNKTAPTK